VPVVRRAECDRADPGSQQEWNRPYGHRLTAVRAQDFRWRLTRDASAGLSPSGLPEFYGDTQGRQDPGAALDAPS
jgi:hypothetical protein